MCCHPALLWLIEPLACPCREVLTVARMPPPIKSIKLVVAETVSGRGAERIVAEEWKLDPGRAELVCRRGKGAQQGGETRTGQGTCDTAKRRLVVEDRLHSFASETQTVSSLVSL